VNHKKTPAHEVIHYIYKELNSLSGYKIPQISLFEFELHIYYALQNNYVWILWLMFTTFCVQC